ncbi:electron transporter RnfE [Ruminococcaceae bacterium OttesenSCG-928-O06]|nr:electron transporter RnfE [Ruminococcaceae bacterium OttesenSCG-928-O06]
MRDDRIRYFAKNMDRLSRRDRVFLNNPVIMQGLGLAPVVIPATTLGNAFILAVGVALLLTPTRMIATFIGQRTGSFLARAVTYALTAGVVYIGVGYIIDYLFGTGALAVGIYLPLLVLEPLIIKRYESPKRERLITSFKKGVITTIGFCLVLFLMAGLRELLALGTLGGIEILRVSLLPMASMPAGGFILLGLVASLWRGLVNTFKKNISLGVKNLQ